MTKLTSRDDISVIADVYDVPGSAVNMLGRATSAVKNQRVTATVDDENPVKSSSKPVENIGQAKEKSDDINPLTMMMWMGELQRVSDEDGTVSGNQLEGIVKMAEMAGLDAPLKQFIEKVTGKPYSEFASHKGDMSFFVGHNEGFYNFSVSTNGSLRDRINQIVLSATQRMDGLAYGMGSRTGANGRIDCSGFIGQLAKAVDVNVNGHLTSFSSTMSGTAESIYVSVAKKIGGTGRLDRNDLVQMKNSGQLQEGMVLSTDKGATRSGFDANRKYGIDHIVMTARENGHLIVVESSSGKGVHKTDFDDWIKSKGNTTFFVTDMANLAENTRPRMQMAAHHAPSPQPPQPA